MYDGLIQRTTGVVGRGHLTSRRCLVVDVEQRRGVSGLIGRQSFKYLREGKHGMSDAVRPPFSRRVMVRVMPGLE